MPTGGGGRDDVLGLIRIGGGMRIGAASDVVSIHSGLTSSECGTAPAAATHARTATPTDFGIGIGGDDPPMVSPISRGGSFDCSTEGGDDEGGHPLNATMESTIATDEEGGEALRRLSPPVLERRAKSDGDFVARVFPLHDLVEVHVLAVDGDHARVFHRLRDVCGMVSSCRSSS